MTEQVGLGVQFRDLAQQREAYRLGGWIFIASEVMLFSGLFLAYLIARMSHPAGFAEGSQELHHLLGSINTGVLLTSSLTMAFAVQAVEKRDYRRSSRWLWVTLVLGIAFLAIKGYEWHEEFLHGRVPGLSFTYTGPHGPGVLLFYWFYFTSTGLHALHVTIGVLCNLWFALVCRYKDHWIPDPSPVVLAGLYWHLVDLVWIFLFPLLYQIGGAPS